jgi:2-polyprenyl-3-methyl-5-hydroxy-6-metoxy-1,4-benzoquinol methylase
MNNKTSDNLINESWDDYAAEWDKNEDAILYSEKAFESLTNIINLEALQILDFGCGTGLLTEKMSKSAKKIVALDTSRKMLSILKDKKLPNVSAVSDQISEATIKENSSFSDKFDLITASSVFGFLPDYQATLLLLKSLLVPGGLVVQWDWLSPANDPEFGFSVKQVETAYKETDFELLSITKPFSLASAKGTMAVIMAVAKNSDSNQKKAS